MYLYKIKVLVEIEHDLIIEGDSDQDARRYVHENNEWMEDIGIENDNLKKLYAVTILKSGKFDKRNKLPGTWEKDCLPWNSQLDKTIEELLDYKLII